MCFITVMIRRMKRTRLRISTTTSKWLIVVDRPIACCNNSRREFESQQTLEGRIYILYQREGKGRHCCLGDFNSLHILHRDDLKKRMNSSFSSYHSGAKQLASPNIPPPPPSSCFRVGLWLTYLKLYLYTLMVINFCCAAKTHPWGFWIPQRTKRK